MRRRPPRRGGRVLLLARQHAGVRQPGRPSSSLDDDASFTGSYQFGFQDSYYDQFQQQSAEWDDEDQVPALLARWQPGPAVRLAWCRVHNGEFGPPRRSEGYVALTGGQLPDLMFLGRAWDSLYFEVIGAQPATGDGDGGDTSPPGFRYDLPADHAVALPEVLQPSPPAATYPGGLGSYPFFAYTEPGARLFPASWFPAALTVAGALRARCGYDLALRWYRRAFDPLQHDCAWMHCSGSTDSERGSDANGSDGACCDSTQVTEEAARDRAVTLHYARTLIDWADALMRRGNAPEAFGQARVLYDTAARIAGPRPRAILLPEPASAPSVTSFVPAYPPLNPELMRLYDLIADRQGLIRLSLDAARIRNGRPGRDMPYFQRHDAISTCADGEQWCGRPSPYRFAAQIAKAIELAGRVRELGAALLSALREGRRGVPGHACTRSRNARCRRWASRSGRTSGATPTGRSRRCSRPRTPTRRNLLYYTGLYQNGLLNDEIQNLDLTMNALMARTGANVVEAIGEIMNIIPDPFVGAMSSGASVPAGSKLAHLFEAIGRIMQTVADIQSTTAGMDMTQAGWQRRAAEWVHQMQTLPIEIQQIELQILGAHRRRDQALRELNNHQRQIEHSHGGAGFPAGQVHRHRAVPVPAGGDRRHVPADVRAGPAGGATRPCGRSTSSSRTPTGGSCPRRTGTACTPGCWPASGSTSPCTGWRRPTWTENRREFELTKHISLRLDFPVAYLQLRTAGYCEISIPEWMFDVDYPGQYMRRIKSLQADAPLRGRPADRRALPPDPAEQHDPGRARRSGRPLSTAAATAGEHSGYELCHRGPARSSASTPRASRSPPRPGRTTPACSSSASGTSGTCRSSTAARSAGGASSCRRRTTTSTWTR